MRSQIKKAINFKEQREQSHNESGSRPEGIGEEIGFHPGLLQYPTFHLKNFSLLERAVALYGDRYGLMMKALWYLLHGEIKKTEIAKLGDVQTDLRMNLSFALPSGKGKKHIEVVTLKVCEGLGEAVAQPTSYHPEQLVGKTIRYEKDDLITYQQIKGHLADDVVIFDDAIDLIRGKQIPYRDSRKYLCAALDPIGKNTLTKKAVGIPREHALKYDPTCTILLLFQPFSIPEEAFLCGLFRRLPIIYLEYKDHDFEKDFALRVEGDGKGDQARINLSAYLKAIKEFDSQIPTISEDAAKERFTELSFNLVNFGKCYGDKSAGFTDMIAFPLQDFLLKMATILAYSRRQKVVGIFDVEMAFVDLLEIIHSTLNFVEKKVLGSLDYGESWKGAKGKDQEVLEWLHEQGALSETTSTVSINSYIEKIGEVFNIKEPGARKRYQNHKRAGWVEGKQVGSHASVVYLKFKPQVKDVGGLGDRVVREYLQIIRRNAQKYSPIPYITHN